MSLAAASCPVCGSGQILSPKIVGKDRLLGVPGRFEVAICANCGAGHTLPRVDDDALGSYYTSTYHTYNLESGGLFETAWRLGQRLRWAREFAAWPLSLFGGRSGAVLDVGCGRGDLGEQLMSRGWTVSGLDPSAQAVEIARSRGIDAQVSHVQNAKLREESFDAVTMLHALEHVNDPTGDLGAIRRYLKPGGQFVALMPNFGSWQRLRMGALWFHLDLPRHRTHFTRRSLRIALEQAGFVDIQIDDVFDAGALGGTLQYRWFDRVVAISGWPAAGWVVGSQILSPVVRQLDRLAGESDILAVSARRP